MVFHDGGKAEDFHFSEIDSLEFNMNFAIDYVSLAQAVAVKLQIHATRGGCQ